MTQDPHSLTGAYALDALDPEERHEFEDHLRSCEACAEEVREMLATAARLGSDAAVVPSESLHRQVMAQVRTTRQLGPDQSARDARGVVRSLQRARSRSPILMTAAAALLVVSGALGAVAVSEQRRATRAEQAAKRVTEVLEAPDTRTMTAAGPSGSSVRVLFSSRQGRVVFVPHAMSAPKDRDLQLWVIGNGTFRSVGLIEGSRPIVAEGVDSASKLGVTVEPDGGSRQPTSAPVMQVSLA
jgi:anti-sigma-K factor RskA